MLELQSASRTAWTLLEPLHAVTYFAPESHAAFKEAGYRGFWMGYFAGRAAPFGAVPAGMVHASFYNFAYARVQQALPAAWTFAPPSAALAARERGAVAALRRCLGPLVEDPSVARASELASRLAYSAPSEGRPLFAANQALDEPSAPLARLWHAATLLREHRGDGHNAALMAAGITGRESHVFRALANGTGRDMYAVARDFSESEWATCTESLRRKGLVAGGKLSELGARTNTEIEDRTDSLAAHAFVNMPAEELNELLDLLRPVTQSVVALGEIPLDSPMGLNLRHIATAVPFRLP